MGERRNDVSSNFGSAKRYGSPADACQFTDVLMGRFSDWCGQPAAYVLTSTKSSIEFLGCVDHTAEARQDERAHLISGVRSFL